jgi:hypothetical protein
MGSGLKFMGTDMFISAQISDRFLIATKRNRIFQFLCMYVIFKKALETGLKTFAD